MPIDPKAPIMPGVGAAGLLLGADVERTATECGGFAGPEEIVNDVVPGPNHVRYRSPMVDLWAIDGRITQIGVHGRYAGQLLGCIGIGSTVGEAQQLIGQVLEDEEDSLAFAELPGVCVDFEPQSPLGANDWANPIEWIFVYVADEASCQTRDLPT